MGTLTIEHTTQSRKVTIEPLLEPCHRVLLLDVVLEADAFLLPPPGDTGPRTIHHDVEVHTEDTNAGVVRAPRSMCSCMPKLKSPVSEKLP
jgi:hypothetical protein